MKSSLLFPPVFRIIGFVLAVPGLVLGYLFEYVYYDIPFFRYGPDHMSNGSDSLADEVAITLIVTGLLFVGFSRLKKETKNTTGLRLTTLYWSVLVNCILIVGVFILVALGHLLNIVVIIKSVDSLYWLIFYNFFIPLLIFIGRFYYLLYRSKNGRKIKPLYFIPQKPYNLIGKVVSVPLIILALLSIILPATAINAIWGIDTNSVVFFGLPPFLLLWIWSKEKNELAIVKNTRLKAMMVGVYLNYGLFLLCTWVIYGVDYLTVLTTCTISIQIVFLAVFYYQLYQLRKKHSKIAPTNL